MRKVLLDAGISTGLKKIQLEVDQSPVIVEQTSDEREPAKVGFLTDAGFRILGKWSRPQPGEIALDADAPKQPGVYAFVLDEVVVYVGLTQSTLKTRLDQYRRGYEGQRTNVRVKGLISDALAAGRVVEVLVAVPEQLEWNGLPVNTVAGLEMGLIKLLKPAWNILGAA